MAARKPLVLGSNGKPQQLQSGDTLAGVSGGGGVAPVQVALDFGTDPVFSKRFSFTATSTVGQNVLMTASAETNGDELEMDGFLCAARVTATDTVEAFIQAVPGPVSGTYRFNLVIG